MKKIIFIICLLFIVGCGKQDINKLEDKLKDLGNDYFSNYMIDNAQQLDIALITIADLKQANEIMDSNYDLTIFKNCKDESSIKIYLKSGTTQIEKYEFDILYK